VGVPSFTWFFFLGILNPLFSVMFGRDFGFFILMITLLTYVLIATPICGLIGFLVDRKLNPAKKKTFAKD